MAIGTCPQVTQRKDTSNLNVYIIDKNTDRVKAINQKTDAKLRHIQHFAD
jgi:hypothetical protein